MTTYKGINGFAVQSVGSDPSPLDEGQVWYNNASYAFKLAAVTTVGTFASGGNMNTARSQLGGSGTQTSSLAYGGRTIPAYLNSSESYNGTSWTNTPSLNTTRAYLYGVGASNTAALAFGGEIFENPASTATELWNGSSWTSNPTGLATARYELAGAGISTAALAFGGQQTPGTEPNATESWNGSSWTASANINTARNQLGASGLQTSALAFGGNTTAATAATESWNGTSWTSVNSMNTARASNLAGFGTQIASVASGGATGAPADSTITGATEVWNGTSWTSNPTGLATVRRSVGGSGSKSDGLVFGGYNGTAVVTNTEEWTGPGAPLTQTITTS